MIIFDMALQWRLLLYSVMIGAALGVFYDALRISRLFLSLPAAPTSPRYYRMLSHLRIFRATGMVAGDINDEPDNLSIRVGEFTVGVVAFIEDIIFFVVSALTLTIFIFHANTGSVRGYLLLGALGGFALYLLTAGRLTMLLGELIVFAVRALTKYIVGHLLIPAGRFIRRVGAYCFDRTFGRLAARIKKRKLRLYHRRRAREILAFCNGAADFINIEELSNEIDQNEHTRKADNSSDLRISHRDLRQHGNQIQQAGGGKSPARGTHRKRQREHRGNPEQA